MEKEIRISLDTASSRAKYHVRLKAYEGPFDVLLELVAGQQVDILDVDLSKLTHDYLEFLKEQKEQEIGITVEFLYVAAILISMKASILTYETDEKLELPISPAELLLKLKELSFFKNAAERLSVLMEKRSLIYPPGSNVEKNNFSKIRRISKKAFQDAYVEVMRRNTPVLSGSHILTANLDLERAMNILNDAFNNCQVISFSDTIEKKKDRRMVISLFFAILTLAQEGVIELYQPEQFSDISIKLVDRSGFIERRLQIEQKSS